MPKFLTTLFVLLLTNTVFSQQMATARDTITVLENYSNASNLDLNYDGVKDLVLYDRLNHVNTGRFRCFVKTGPVGTTTYSHCPELSYLFPTVYNWAVFFDFNCDGKEHLFCSTNSGIKVYRNEGSVSNPINFVLYKSVVNTNYNPGGQALMGNIYASPVGVPGISDIDNDGDLDVLTFSSQGVFVEYHQNMSKEWYNHCDSLVYEYRDYCWGKFSEASCAISLNQCSPVPPISLPKVNVDGKELHAGSCLTCIDSDGDGDKDLVMGDISCNHVQYAHNTGNTTAAFIGDSTRLYPNFPSKNNTTGITLNIFPCAYYVDVNGDNKKDLIATPSAFGSENYKSLWYYNNASATSTLDFQFVKNNFLQEEMIEVGQNAFPLVMDENTDGKPDLLLGTYGFYTGNTLVSKLTLYRNIGTAAQPAFSLITQDYAGLSAQALFHIMPTAGDIDADGDVDLIIGNSTGQVHWLENTAGAGNSCNFSVFKNNPFSFTTTSAEAAPQLYDIDQDGKLDLLIGMKNGKIAFYKNTGSATVPGYSLMNSYFGGVNVQGNASIYGIDGYAVPFFFNDGAGTKLLVGSISGNVFYYDVPVNLTQNFNLVNPNVNNYNEGAQSAPFFVDVNNDGKRDLFLGNAGGGLSFFSSASPFVNLEEATSSALEDKVLVFPNPAQEQLNIELKELEFDKADLRIYDMSGREIKQVHLYADRSTLELKELPAGMYLLAIQIQNKSVQRTVYKKCLKSE
jgi:hypothetical protein